MLKEDVESYIGKVVRVCFWNGKMGERQLVAKVNQQSVLLQTPPDELGPPNYNPPLESWMPMHEISYFECA